MQGPLGSSARVFAASTSRRTLVQAGSGMVLRMVRPYQAVGEMSIVGRKERALAGAWRCEPRTAFRRRAWGWSGEGAGCPQVRRAAIRAASATPRAQAVRASLTARYGRKRLARPTKPRRGPGEASAWRRADSDRSGMLAAPSVRLVIRSASVPGAVPWAAE
jgi:hypothetical protein